jgi:uncharacterized delta-60 repeat protein
VTRLNSNGSLDTTYGVGGRTALTSFESMNASLNDIYDLALQSGKAVVLSQASYDGGRFEGDRRFGAGLMRFNTNGTIDNTFGSGDGQEIYVSPIAENEFPAALAVDAQSRLVIAGRATLPFGADEGDDDLFVLRIAPGGQADPSFGTGGHARVDFDQPRVAADFSHESARDVAVMSDGRIVALSRMEISGGYGVARFLGATTTPPGTTPSLSIADASTFEGNSGTKTLSVTVSLSSASSNAVTVKYRTKNQTAGEGDYGVVAAGSLTFAPGQTSKTISIVIKGDTKIEGDETFRIELFENVNATILDGVGVITIKNDD